MRDLNPRVTVVIVPAALRIRTRSLAGPALVVARMGSLRRRVPLTPGMTRRATIGPWRVITSVAVRVCSQ